MTVDIVIGWAYILTMRYVKFTVETDHNITGEIGIVPSTARNWEAYIPARQLSHDLLDHSVTENGFYYQELAALGGFTFRTNFGQNQPQRMYSYAQTLAWDVVSSLRDNQDIIDAPKHRLTKAEEMRFDVLLDEVRPRAVEAYASEFEFDIDQGDVNFFEVDENWLRVRAWLKYGYSRAQRRFSNNDWMTMKLGEAIDKAITDAWQGLESWADSGREFTLAMDYENAYARIDGIW